MEPRIHSISTFSRAQNVWIAALSNASPVEPNDRIMSGLAATNAKPSDVWIPDSTLDAVNLAAQHPDREVVFFAIGFETTAPANAMAVHLAEQRGLENFSVLVSHVLVPRAIDAIVSSPTNRVDGFLAAGHVCSVMGTWQYEPLVARFGIVPEGVDIRPSRATAGDVVIVSGPIGQHGVANMSRREGLEFGTEMTSDSAPLNGLVAAMLDAFRDLHVLRDATRGGVTASLCEIAGAGRVGIEYEESLIPVPDDVAAACSFLGLDAMSIANEDKLVATVPTDALDDVLGAMHAHPLGTDACVIGRVVDDHPGVATTAFGACRVVDVPLGEQLPASADPAAPCDRVGQTHSVGAGRDLAA
ncbi:MAG: AIR synthase-related protein [Ilumatobacter sp.]|uniref:AIR synthase-related protein n=1 Tax=Ilumatobacter sp. TaxID=1967498 RepID=UPI00391CE6F6